MLPRMPRKTYTVSVHKIDNRNVVYDDNNNEAAAHSSTRDLELELLKAKQDVLKLEQANAKLRARHRCLGQHFREVIQERDDFKWKLKELQLQLEVHPAIEESIEERSVPVAVPRRMQQQVRVEAWPYEESAFNKAAMIEGKKGEFAMYRMDNNRERVIMDGKATRSKIYQQILPGFFEFHCSCDKCKEKMKQERTSKSWVTFGHFAKWKGSVKIPVGTQIMCTLCKEERNKESVTVVKNKDGPEMLVHMVETKHSKIYFKTVSTPKEVITQEQLLQMVSRSTDHSESLSDSGADCSL